MIYQILSNEPLDEIDYIVSKDDEAASEAVWDQKFYDGQTVVSSQRHAETLAGLDFIESPQGVLYCSRAFLEVLSAARSEPQIRVGLFCSPDGEALLEGRFWQIIPPRAPVEFEDVDPVRYWPKFKKFKFWNGVLHQKDTTGAWLGSIEEVPGLFCSEELKVKLEDASLDLSFAETPTLLG